MAPDMAQGAGDSASLIGVVPEPGRIPSAPISLAAEEIAANPRLLDCLRIQARALLQVYEVDPISAAVMATQQRWLLAHAGLALYFETGAREIRLGKYFERVARLGIASRNTADVFIKELVHYGMLRQIAGEDRRQRPVAPAESTVQAMGMWISIHLATLDGLDQGKRLQRFLSTDGAIARLHPAIAERLMSRRQVRRPHQKTVSLFTWLDNGGLFMEWLVASLRDPVEGSDRIGTGVFSTAEMANWLKLSRSHLNRKLREAERAKSIGWEGDRKDSLMWISQGFLAEIIAVQAAKLSAVDSAFTALFGQPEHRFHSTT